MLFNKAECVIGKHFVKVLRLCLFLRNLFIQVLRSTTRPTVEVVETMLERGNIIREVHFMAIEIPFAKASRDVTSRFKEFRNEFFIKMYPRMMIEALTISRVLLDAWCIAPSQHSGARGAADGVCIKGGTLHALCCNFINIRGLNLSRTKGANIAIPNIISHDEDDIPGAFCGACFCCCCHAHENKGQ